MAVLPVYVGLLPAERVAEATLDGVTSKCPGAVQIEETRPRARTSGYWLAREDTATGEEDVREQRGREEEKDTTTEQAGSNGDSQKTQK
ncbi:hypothetical protein NDU88_006356 [Pleurodeles waltl]|uniref:Uncharacterized protein n=1 Tax=Pleurodeles waltl TaxID=8319 RepID=A0AAV7N062_PLEWA|nr:hypothetical protein NDU88_006356 [Pleurodeles waltl]